MSKVGFYRYKTTADSQKNVSFYVNTVLVSTKSITPIDSCNDDLIVKFLDFNGQYRFFNFYSKYEISNNPSKIGFVNKFITDIETAQSDISNVGYENEKQISASIDINSDMIEIFAQMYSSPRVYMYIGDGTTDLDSDWLEVDIEFNNPISNIRRGNQANIDAIITLPKQYSIKMV